MKNERNHSPEESLPNNGKREKNGETKGQLKAKIMKNKQLTHDRAELLARRCGPRAGGYFMEDLSDDFSSYTIYTFTHDKLKSYFYRL